MFCKGKTNRALSWWYDNVINQKLIIFQLKKLGLSAKIAGNGRRRGLTRAPYTLVFMDCQMPGWIVTKRRNRSPESTRTKNPDYCDLAGIMPGKGKSVALGLIIFKQTDPDGGSGKGAGAGCQMLL